MFCVMEKFANKAAGAYQLLFRETRTALELEHNFWQKLILDFEIAKLFEIISRFGLG